MLIAHVLITVAPKDRDEVMATLVREAPGFRAMPGCLALQAFADPEDPGRVTVMHEWASPAAFAAYTTSDRFAEIGKTLRALSVAPPVSRRFDAALIEALV